MYVFYIHLYMASLLTRALIHSLLLNRPFSLSLALALLRLSVSALPANLCTLSLCVQKLF